MKIYLLTQTKVTNFDVSPSLVVTAESEEEARLIYPKGADKWGYKDSYWAKNPETISCIELGIANPDIPSKIILLSL